MGLSRHPRVALAAVSVVLLAAACDTAGDGTLVVSGRVELDNVRVGSRVGGRVSLVPVAEGDRVTSGAAVVLLDDAELRAQLEQASASRRQAQAQLALLVAGSRPEEIASAEALVSARSADLELRRKGFRTEEIQQAEAEVSRARTALELARKELERTETLRRSGTVQQRDLDVRAADFASAQAQLEVALQREALVRSGSRPEEIAAAAAQLSKAEHDLELLRNGPRPEEIAAQRAVVEAATAHESRIRTQLDEMRVTAPADCVVETLDLRPGDLVRGGEPVAVLNLPNRPWVRCYVPENRLAQVRTGAAVEVTIDSAAGRRFRGQVRRVSSEAEFTPRNVQTTEKRAELVFETKVDVLDGTDTLRAGMYADVHIPAGGTP